MAEREILERLDAHLARSNEHLARGNELMVEMTRLHENTRRFMRDITRRNEIVLGEIARESRAGREVLVGVRNDLADLHQESVAGRQAILILIDELRAHGLGGRNR